MSRVEVKMPSLAHGSQVRGEVGRFSGVQDAFRTAATDVLKKFALYDEANAPEMMAKIFRKSNFGYNELGKGQGKGGLGSTWGKPHVGGSEVGDSFGVGPRPTTGAV